MNHRINIFATSDDPRACALALDDRRVVKMGVESGQMLSTALSLVGVEGPSRPLYRGHPCVVWAAASRLNYEWLLEHLRHLELEHLYRFHKKGRIRSHVEVLAERAVHLPRKRSRDDFPNCTAFRDVINVHHAYRLHLADKWARAEIPPKWTGRGYPGWLQSWPPPTRVTTELRYDREDRED